MTAFYIVNTATATIAGFATSAKHVAPADHIMVSAPEDMAEVSLQDLTNLYNAVTGKTQGKFKIAKLEAAKKVIAAMDEAVKAGTIAKVDEVKVAKPQAKALTKGDDVTKMSKKAKEVIEGAEPKVRKVRDSKLQRMAAAFRELKRDGTPRHFTIAELMAKAGTAEPQTHVYISILRNKDDRFVMDIVKTEDKKYHLAQAAA